MTGSHTFLGIIVGKRFCGTFDADIQNLLYS